jgi:predicted pyridoxine 5'-phosphate oxidase superfamily flavin-nucleotide-binding protein
LDSIRNIVKNPCVALIFLVPGITHTFRVNGRAFLSRDPALTEQFVVQGSAPRTVIVVQVKEAYIHCSRAMMRSDLWNPAKFATADKVPSFGTIMAAHTCGFVDGPALDQENKTRMPLTLY